MLRAKFRCDKVEKHSGEMIGATLSAVTDGSEENNDFNKHTPSGTVEMWVDNPKAEGFFKEGEEYYLDFSKAEQGDKS